MRLIDADALKKELEFWVLSEFYRHILLEHIDNAPTVEPKKGEWKVRGIGINTQKNIWHVVCPKCNCDMFTEFTSYCPNCGEPKKEISIAELDMRGDEKC